MLLPMLDPRAPAQKQPLRAVRYKEPSTLLICQWSQTVPLNRKLNPGLSNAVL